MKMKSTNNLRKLLFVSFLAVTLLLAATPVAAWWGSATPAFDYDWDYDGGITDTWDVSKTTGYIKIENRQTFGNAYAIAYIGELVTTPNYGDAWTIEFRVNHDCDYQVGSLFWGTYSLYTHLEIWDSSMNTRLAYDIDLEIEDENSGSSYLARSPTHWFSSTSLDPNTSYYLIFYIDFDFNGWVWMEEYGGSGNARFDVNGIYWNFLVD